MTVRPEDREAALRDTVADAWRRFVEMCEPLRPELFRYCRYLTRSPWDAEDLVQDAMARAFVTLGCVSQTLPNPRAWLFRVASNLWIDRTRRAREVPHPAPDPVQAEPPDWQGVREAAGTLLVRLAPQERTAVVLKDVFDMTLEEIALALSTTVGAVKAALHRGRGKLGAPEVVDAREACTPTPAALDAFCEAFNARDLDRLTTLLLDNATVEIVGLVTEYGPAAATAPERGSFRLMLLPLGYDPRRGGVHAPLLGDYVPSPARAEVRAHRDELIVLCWYRHHGGEAVRDVLRIETEGDRLSRVRNYFFAPDVIAEVCRELSVPFRSNGYRYWYDR